jgi:hypothetical protein
VARQSSGEESEHHIVAIRLRVKGVGNLKLSLTDLDDVQIQNLVPLAMQTITRFEPTRLANFQSQRIRLVGKTTEINEGFSINRIVINGKPVAVEYPQ